MSESTTGPDINKKVHRSLAWVSLASSMVGILDILAFALIVAFWVPKEQVGVGFIVISLFPILDIATDLGMAAAAIQRDDHSRSRLSTVFWLNVGMSLLVFTLLTVGLGPLLVYIHGQPVITGLLALYGVKVIWQNVYFLPYALMKKELRFKELSVIRILANFAEFAGKIGFAAAGFGVWCFVAGPLCRVFVTGIKFREGWDWAKFGLKTSAHKILFRLYSMADKQIVGAYFGAEALAVYGTAYLVVIEPALVISEITANVAFPAFSKLKHSTEKLYEQLVSFCKMNLVIMFLFVGFAFVAAEEILAVVSLQKGSDYSSGAPIIRLLCGIAILRALSYVIPPLLDGVGRPTLTLIYTSVAAVVLCSLFLVFAKFVGPDMGIASVGLAWLIGYPIAFMVLIRMAFAILEMPSYKLYGRLAGITACGLGATGLAAATKWAAQDLPTPVRAGCIALVMLTSYSLFLSRFQNISLRTVRKSF
jgi:O-antigen/teichoic acid export membrane protein